MKIAKRSELVSIDQIIPYARNARTHSKDQIIQIRASFREFGVISPLVVDEHYNLLVGHGRLEAARAEGLDALDHLQQRSVTHPQAICHDHNLVSSAVIVLVQILHKPQRPIDIRHHEL